MSVSGSTVKELVAASQKVEVSVLAKLFGNFMPNLQWYFTSYTTRGSILKC